MQQRKKLGLSYEKRPAVAPDPADRERPEPTESLAPQYDPRHDPELVSDDEIPW